MEARREAAFQPPLGKIDLEECTRKFIPLVRRMAHRMKHLLPTVVDHDDLVQLGLLGLLQAAKRYNGPRDQFRYFSRLRIRGAMIDGLRERDSAPRRLRRSARHLRHCICRLEQSLARAPTGREIAAEMQLTLTQYHRLLQEQDAHEPVDLSLEEQQEVPGQDSVAHADPLNSLVEQCDRQRLLAALSELPKRERSMMKLRLNDSLELRRIAVLFGVAESRVCQLLRETAARMRSRLDDA